MNPSLTEMFRRLLKAVGQTRAAKSVEVFGWLILVESVILMLAPPFAVELLHLPALEPQGANYLGSSLCSSAASGRSISSAGASMRKDLSLPRCLWPAGPAGHGGVLVSGTIPGPLALFFAVQDFGSFLWTSSAWRAESRQPQRRTSCGGGDALDVEAGEFELVN